ncbi:uncharacterized protein [Oscarella lobularis]|uniref:uncharacterized protein isoform X2 n=1 Tax=Oscarella lobularis TaxID=121494 RepID=UPI003313940A
MSDRRSRDRSAKSSAIWASEKEDGEDSGGQRFADTSLSLDFYGLPSDDMSPAYYKMQDELSETIRRKSRVKNRESGQTNFDPSALLAAGTVKVARVRVNVIGQGGVGKTCLVRLLLGQKFKEQVSTCGIEMKNAAITMMQYHCSADYLTGKAREGSTKWKLLDDVEYRVKLRQFFQKSKAEKKPREEVSVSGASQSSLTSEQRRLIRDIVADPSRLGGVDNVILMRICDFGGQEPFLTAHAALMPAGSLSIYLLVFNGALRLTDKAESSHVTEDRGEIPQKLVRMRTNDDFLKHWSSSVHIAHPPKEHGTFIGEEEHVNYPAIFLISTHRMTAAFDVLKENSRHLKTLFREKEIQSHFVNTTSPHMFFLVENKTSGTENEDPTANKIRMRVDDMTRNFYEKQDVQPARWLKFEDVMSLLKTIIGRSMAKMSLIREVAEECRIETNGEISELERALKHLTHVGSVFYFPEVDVLKDFVFYDSNWLINLLASFVGSAHSEPAAPKLKSHWQRAIKSGFLSTDLVNSLLQLAKVSKDEYDAAKGILDYFDIITETKEGSEDKGYVSPCLLQSDFEGQSEYSKAFSSDRKDRLPPPLVLFVEGIVFFPESFFFRLVTRFLRRRRRVYDGLLRRNRMVFPVSSGVDAEFLYQSELNCATLTVFTKNSSLSSEELSKMTKECVSLRMSLAKDIEEAKRRGMAGLQCRLYCQVRERRDENLYDTLAETDDYDITEDVWILANGTGQLSCDERQGMGLWFGGGKRSADTILAMLATEAFFCDLAEQSQNDWQAIARKLGFGQAEIGAIENDFYGVKEQCIRMLCRWLDREGSVGTLAVLKEAYKNAKLIGQFDTAVKEHF